MSRLAALALLLTGSPEFAQDAAQEAFVRLLKANPDPEQGTLSGYLSTIVYHFALKENRRTGRHQNIENQSLESDSPSALEQMVRNERERLVVRAICALDDAHRTTIALRFYGNHSYEEIAALTGVPMGTVKSRLFYAVKQCREWLKRKGVLEECM
jgi:RNA polymerase sigma-70 factor (ECF subfamily)